MLNFDYNYEYDYTYFKFFTLIMRNSEILSFPDSLI